MQTTKLIFHVFCLAGLTSMFSCESAPKDALDQAKAEQAIKTYILGHGFEYGDEYITAKSIQKFDKATTGADKQTSIKTYFNNEAGTKTTILVFNFANPTKDQWVLHSIKPGGDVSKELAEWVGRKTALNEPVR